MTATPDRLALDGRYRQVLAEIAAAATAAGRPVASVRLMAASKEQPAARIGELLALGHRLFGENRVAEAADKWPALKRACPDAELHLIGPLQTNKARAAVALFDGIDSLDRPRLAEALAREMDRAGRRPACLVEVNTGDEPQKSGVPPDQADAFIAACRERWNLPVAGLMCVPPAGADPVPHFVRLAGLAARHGLSELSMGMSGDFAQAVRCGATIVRVGTAIFGRRG